MDKRDTAGLQRAYSLEERADQAREQIGSTRIERWPKLVLVFSFLLVLFEVPLVQLVREGRAVQAGQDFSSLDIFARAREALGVLWGGQPPTSLSDPDYTREALAKDGWFDRLLKANRFILRSKQAYEDDLRDGSWLTTLLRAQAQRVQTGLLGVGNEKTLVGEDGWLFFHQSISHLTGPGFLDENHQARRRAQGNEWRRPPQPDPVLALLHFRLVLAKRGILLVVVPVPNKPAIYPDRFSTRYAGCPHEAVRNASWQQFMAELRQPVRFFEGRFKRYQAIVRNPAFAAWRPYLAELERHRAELERSPTLVYDPAPDLLRARCGLERSVFLKSDLHWRPEGLAQAASGLARFLEQHLELGPADEAPADTRTELVEGRGDIGRMLGLPLEAALRLRERVIVTQVLEGDGLWRPDRDAQVLLLGGSFTNIYSLEPMGWGEGGGLAERLSLELRRPVDSIARNDRGAHQSRQELNRELSRGRDRLQGKKAVVFEFDVRELTHGDWKLLPMNLGQPPAASLWTPKSGESIQASGSVHAISHVPRPHAVPYKDHLCAVELVDLETAGRRLPTGSATVAYMQSMKDHRWTSVPRLRLGERIQVSLSAWDDSGPLASLNRSDLERWEFEDHSWAELLSDHSGSEQARSQASAGAHAGPGWPEGLALLVLALLLAAMLLLIDRRERRGKQGKREPLPHEPSAQE